MTGPAGSRRRRRYVAPPHNLGPSSDALFDVPLTTPVSSSPAGAGPAPAGAVAARTADAADEPELLPERAGEDLDAAWGDRPDDGAHEESLRRDRPPHWE
ncbi:hypothetical protein [Georgenia sp. MJ170]|uniref:hypothetical protein n=1 Tax=Georgenia sunbinii TaxID=3117728 RepID=UPI002F26263B